MRGHHANRRWAWHGNIIVPVGNGESYGNDGTGSFPVGTIMLTPSDVVYTAIQAAPPGTTLGLTPGTYDFRDYGNLNKSGAGVTIQGQNGVNIVGIVNTTCNGLHWKYMTAVTANGSDFTSNQGMITCNNSFDCSYDHISCTGTVDGTSRPRGVQIGFSTGVTISHCDFNQIGGGLNAVGTQGGNDCYGISFLNNRVRKFIENGFLITDVNDIKIIGNLVWYLDIDTGGHNDSIQLTRTGSASQATLFDPITNRNWSVWIEANNMQSLSTDIVAALGTSTGVEGIPLSESMHSLLLRRNVSFGCVDNAGTVANGSADVLIDQNFYQGTNDSPVGFPKGTITIRNACDQVTATNNTCTGFGFDVPGVDTPSTNISAPLTGAGANTIISNASTYTDTALRDAFVAAHSVPHGFNI